MPDYSLPRYLQPPTDEEKARMDALEQAATEKSVGMMKRWIGMRRMEAQTKEAIANGVDPVTARQNAFLNNSSLLLWNNPEAISNITESQQANRIRERALLQSQQQHETNNVISMLRLKQQEERNKQLASDAAATLEERRKYHEGRLNQTKPDAQTIEPEIRVLTDPDTGEKMSVYRSGPNSWQATQRKPGEIGEIDKMQLGNLYSELKSANRDLRVLGAPTEKDSEEVLNQRTALVNRKATIQKSIDRLTKKPKAAPAAKPAATEEKPATEERVKVKSPDGKIGSVPASQLPEALKAGYSKVE